MLKTAKNYDIADIMALCDGSIVGTKILCQIEAYGLERDFLNVWILKDAEITTAVIAAFYDDLALIASDDADFEQLGAFLAMFFYKSLTLPESLCDKLDICDYISKKGYRFDSTAGEVSTEKLTEAYISDAYKLISKEIPGSFSGEKEAYLSFLSDYTFRERRDLARGVCTLTDGKLSSVAITSAETKDAAVISGVACDGNLRKKGLGKRTVLSMVAILENENKKPYVIALNKSAEGFYEHIGFTFKENIAFVERK